jgi:glycosyltransferase involved in cell wall biosynthesis
MTVLPTITVVVPCYNAERWIGATLRSVLTQQWAAPLDIVVVDDGSKDGSADLVSREFPQVRLLRQANSGVAAARNLGIAQARGDWIAFVDADDIWLPAKLQTQWDALQAQPGAQMACSSWRVWESTEPEPDPAWLEELSKIGEPPAAMDVGPSGWIYTQLLQDCQVWTSTVVAKRELFAAIGSFDTSLRIGEDLDLWLRASRVTPIVRVQRPLALYRMHPHSITKGAPARNYQAEVIDRAVQRWGYDSPDGQRARPAEIHRALARTWRDFAGAHLASGSLANARLGAWMAIKHDWRHAGAWKLLARSALQAGVRGARG